MAHKSATSTQLRVFTSQICPLSETNGSYKPIRQKNYTNMDFKSQIGIKKKKKEKLSIVKNIDNIRHNKTHNK